MFLAWTFLFSTCFRLSLPNSHQQRYPPAPRGWQTPCDKKALVEGTQRWRQVPSRPRVWKGRGSGSEKRWRGVCGSHQWPWGGLCHSRRRILLRAIQAEQEADLFNRGKGPSINYVNKIISAIFCPPPPIVCIGKVTSSVKYFRYPSFLKFVDVRDGPQDNRARDSPINLNRLTKFHKEYDYIKLESTLAIHLNSMLGKCSNQTFWVTKLGV